ncbi:MAG: hypothetical protein DMF78_07955 [Acidobacteria bacterium]|nr:MAG: hypothetical protein DMF78_07955 [Acidobacteriota bacterium]
MRSVTSPFSVNLKALARRFLSTCCRRLLSVCMALDSAGSVSTLKPRPRDSATWRKLRSTYSARSAKARSPT